MSSDTTGSCKPPSDGEMNKLHAKLIKAEMLGNTDLIKELKDKIEESKKIADEFKKNLLTDAEKNKLHAKIIKAEMMGKHDLVKELKEKLEYHEKFAAGQTASNSKSSSTTTTTATSSSTSSTKQSESDDNTRIMTVKKRVNEESMSVKQLYKREKTISMLKDSIMFVSSSAKAADKNGEFDVDNEYEETAKKNKKPKSDYIVSEEKQKDEETLCPNCLPNFYPANILSRGKKVFLTLGKDEPLVDGHCFIRSIIGGHYGSDAATSFVASDEETVKEVDLLKQKLSLMFSQERKAVIFTELWARGRKKYDNHLVIECIPIKDKYIDDAWMYFKKELQESESEWADNKSVVDIKGKPVSRCLPDGLSYFWVTFGPSNEGYGHVIEDESRFPPSFAHEIIAGIIDIDDRKWRKPRKDYRHRPDDVLKFKASWRKHDPFYEQD